MLEAVLYEPFHGCKLLIIGRTDALHFVPNFSKKIMEWFLELLHYTRPVNGFESRSFCIVRALISCYHIKQPLHSPCSLVGGNAHPSFQGSVCPGTHQSSGTGGCHCPTHHLTVVFSLKTHWRGKKCRTPHPENFCEQENLGEDFFSLPCQYVYWLTSVSTKHMVWFLCTFGHGLLRPVRWAAECWSAPN